MGFLSLYRKYRPRSFADLVGQKHVVKTLQNAIKNQRIAHAYLFTGPRGTGKTSTAKVFAQALNCEQGPSLEPCGQCAACQKIQHGQSMDVMEIDAASNRGIDEIRDLREKIKFYPSEGSYKVYIIDEVHMLTTGAFNALLKTLEEPPERVVFILATTEPHKVLETILSRCQRFDFSLLSVADIQERLEYISKAENIKYEKEALSIIARSSRGGLRDAISLLDQAISYTNAQLTVAQVQEMLGKVDQQVLKEFFQLTFKQKTAEALELVNDLINGGKGIATFVNDLIEYARRLILLKECGVNSQVLNDSPEVLNNLAAEAANYELARLLRIIEILSQVERELTYTQQPRLALEMGVIKISSPEADNSLAGLQARVAELEYRMRQIKVGETGAEATEQKAEGKQELSETVKEVVSDGQSSQEQLTLEKITQAWPVILQQVKKYNISVHAYLLEGKPHRVQANTVWIIFPGEKSFHKKGAEREASTLSRIFSKVLGEKCQLEFILEGESPKKKAEKAELKPDLRQGTSLVDKVLEIFDGEIIKVDAQVLNKKGEF